MSFFSNFPYTTYELNGKTFVIRDLFRRASFISEYKPVSDLYETYEIMEGDTAQSIALEYYGAATFHWVVLVFNEIHNMHYEWPLDQAALERVSSAKYGETTMYMTRHFERNGFVVGEVKEFNPLVVWVPPENPGPLDPMIYPVSFLEYETRLNDAKRKILLLRPELLNEFVSQFSSAVNV